MNRILSVILPAVMALTFGCGKSDTVQSSDGKVKVEQSGDTAKYEMTTKEGKSTMTVSDAAVAIPDTFPKDVPILKDAVAKLNMSQGKSEILHLHVPRRFTEVAKEYQDKLKAEGWEIETSMNTEEASILQAKKDGRQCGIVVSKEDAGSMVQLSVAQK